MIGIAELLLEPARQAGIKTPENPRKYKEDDFPHWDLFTKAQLGTPMPSSDSHWENAKVIAQIPEEEVDRVTMNDLVNKGFQNGFPLP